MFCYRIGDQTNLKGFQQGHPSLPRVGTSFLVRLSASRILTRAHEAVAGAIVSDRIVFFTGGLHRVRSTGYRSANTSIVPCIEAINRRGDAGDILRTGAVKHKCCTQILAIGGKAEGLSATPAETRKDRK